MNKGTTYYTWRRSDGYYNSSTFVPPSNTRHTYEILRASTVWDQHEVEDVIKARKHLDVKPE